VVRQDRPRSAGPSAPLTGEPVAQFERSPGQVKLVLNDLDSLFDRASPSAYPHSGPMLDSDVTKYMVDTARQHRRSPVLKIALTFRTPPLRSEEEAGTRASLSSFFSNEAELAGLDERVNRTEAWGSLRYSIPAVVAAAVVAGLFTNPSTLGGPAYLSGLAYLVALVIIWMMLWDPLEKILFDSYFIRLRIRALRKLAAAQVTFTYGPGPSAPAEAVLAESSPLETIRDVIEGQ
jgi:hypothetical protein